MDLSSKIMSIIHERESEVRMDASRLEQKKTLFETFRRPRTDKALACS
jgi:hypothetical protein